jgi:hypothetical protein
MNVNREIRGIILFGCLAFLAPLHGRAQTALPADIIADNVAGQEKFWRSCSQPADNVSSRDIFAYALELCEAHQHPERLDRLFELATKMQDRTPKSRTFGNFWWSWRDGKVMDHNAVDFCMRAGPLLWTRDRVFIPPPAQARLASLLQYAVQGCRLHKVPPSYSNIAIMNAGDLILLGEALGQADAADEGYARLDRLFHYIQTTGIHEFDSPTYTGVDLTGLEMIEALCRRDAGRAEARSLLNLFWTDIALNWFPPAQRLGGANSRTYDYLHGLGELDRQLAWNKWLDEPQKPDLDSVYIFQGRWHPPEKIHALSSQFPRLVRQCWGENWWQSRTHYLLPEITLSSTAAGYGGRMDMPLTVDLAGPRKSVRGYFIADGRDDPFGQKKIAAGAHEKAFHLDPFWTAAQRIGDALGLVLYRAGDIPDEAVTLNSDFVLPLAVDALWAGGRQVSLSGRQAFNEPVMPGDAVAFQKGTAVCGLRVPWSRGVDGNDAKIALVYDGNSFGAVCLAIEHARPGTQPRFGGQPAGAAIWVRVGDGIRSAADFAAWRQQFATATAKVEITSDGIKLQAAGVDGDLFTVVKAPWSVPESVEPPPSRAVLELNGHSIGDRALEGLPVAGAGEGNSK